MAKRKSKLSYTKALAKVGAATKKKPSDYMKALYALHKAGRNPKIGTRLVPARLRARNGKTYMGKVKRVNGKVKIFVTPAVARKINPSGGTKIPGIAKWSRMAGGTSAAEGKYGYDFRTTNQTYTISPVSWPNGRHRGYVLRVYPGNPARGHQSIGGYYSSPAKAVTAAKDWASKNDF